MKSFILGKHLKGYKNISINEKIETYLNPEYVYFPIKIDGTTFTELKSVGDKVLLGEPILMKEGRFQIPVLSSVSGVITSIKKVWHSSGKMVEMWEIKNDFLDEPFYKEKHKCETKDDFISLIKNFGIVGLGGAGFPTYVKYLPTNNADVIIINAAECEPYITCDYMSILERSNDLINGLQIIMKFNGSNRGVIAIKENKIDAINALKEALGEDDSISIYLLKDTYPAGWERYIVEHVTKKGYINLPRETGAIVNNVQTVLAVYDAYYNNKPLVERVVTISGSGIKRPHNFRIRIGTMFTDLLKKCDGYTDDLTNDSYLISGGPMTGKSIIFDDLALTNTVGSVIVKNKNTNVVMLNCIGCGKCSEKCPAFLTPTAIKQAYLSKNIEDLKKLNVMKCVQCGLCSNVCPSRVEMTDYMAKAKDMLIKSTALKK